MAYRYRILIKQGVVSTSLSQTTWKSRRPDFSSGSRPLPIPRILTVMCKILNIYWPILAQWALNCQFLSLVRLYAFNQTMHNSAKKLSAIFCHCASLYKARKVRNTLRLQKNLRVIRRSHLRINWVRYWFVIYSFLRYAFFHITSKKQSSVTFTKTFQ